MASGIAFLVVGVAVASLGKNRKQKVIVSLTLMTAGGLALSIPTISAIENHRLAAYNQTFSLAVGDQLLAKADIPGFVYVGYLDASPLENSRVTEEKKEEK